MSDELPPEQQDVDILMSALRKILNVNSMQFPVVPGGTPSIVTANRRMQELAAKALNSVMVRQFTREAEVKAETATLDV